MDNTYCTTCGAFDSHICNGDNHCCSECGDSEGLVFEDEQNSKPMNKKEGMLLFKDKDIATIEAMHDLLLDHGHSLNERALKESRELTHRMYKALKWSYNPETPYKQKDNE